jgi:hypothetical protein
MKIVALLVTTIVYGFIYTIMDKADKKAFGFTSWIDPFYFSFTTMSTVGYGDYGPKTDIAKMTVMSQQFVLITEILSMLFSAKDSSNKMPQMMPKMMPQMMPQMGMMKNMRQ